MSHSKVSARRASRVLLASVFTFLSATAICRGQADTKKTGDAASTGERPTIRVRAGSNRPLKDSKGNQWLPDKDSKEGGFEGGDTIERPDLKIENTKDP